MTDRWNVRDAELADVLQAEAAKTQRRRCLYCGKQTAALNRICVDHSDLPTSDPNLSEPRLPLDTR